MSFAGQFAAQAPAQIKRVFGSVDFAPWRKTLREYNGTKLRSDWRAGLNVALLAFPQGMAYAMIAGLPISYGMFGSAIACLVGPLFAGSRFVVLGPTNATSVLTLSAFLAAGATEADMALLLPLLLIMVAALQIAAAYLNVGSLITYISRSVIVGYISAAAVLIMANQVRNIAGITVDDAATLLGVIKVTIAGLGGTHWPTVAVSAATAITFLLLKKFTPKLPNVALTLVASTGYGLAATKLGVPVKMLPAVEASAWGFSVPSINLGDIGPLASAALAIAFLGILEGASIGKTLAAQAGDRLNTNQEMFAMGASNLACAFFGGMAASGSLTRSALNASSGSKTPASSLICGILSVVMVFFLGRFVAFIPKSALATVVVFVAISLINMRQIRFVMRATRPDGIVFAVTAGSALLFPLDFAIFIGTTTSIVFYLRQAGEPELTEYAFTSEGQLAAVTRTEPRKLPEISIVHVEGSLFFGAAELLQEQIRRVTEDPNLKIIILRLKHAHHLDASAILALEELVQFMRENDRRLIVSGARKEVYRICKRTGLVKVIGRQNFFVEWPQNPTLSTRNALKRAQEILGQTNADVRVFDHVKMQPSDEG